jgi:hypothetical protein
MGFFYIALVISLLIWVFVFFKKNYSNTIIESKAYAKSLNIEDFFIESDLINVNLPICPNCGSDLGEFPKSNKICNSCREKLFVRFKNQEPFFIKKERKEELYEMVSLSNQAVNLGFTKDSLIPSKTLSELIEKIWPMLNKILSPDDFIKNIEIRKYQYQLLMKEGKSKEQRAHIIEALLRDYSTAIMLLKDNKEKELLSLRVALYLYNNNLDHIEVLKKSKDYGLAYELESKKDFKLKSVEILCNCCDACENAGKNFYTIDEIKKTLPLPHKVCKKFCSCSYLVEINN